MGRGMNTNNVTFSEFYCTNCGNKVFDIPRRKGREREGGHLKVLYCLFCKEEHNCCEVKPFSKYDYEDFRTEFEYDNFKDGKRKMTYGKLKQEIHNGKIEKKKTLPDGGSEWSW
jgi:hypothetical protein